MKIITIILSMIFVGQIMAFKPVLISKFNIDYNNPSGKAFADVFAYDGKRFDKPVIEVLREETSLRLAFEDDDVVYENVSDEILLARPFKLVNLSASATANKATLTTELLRFKNPKTDVTAKKFIMICDGFTNQVEETDKYIQSCTNNSIINLAEFTMGSGSSKTEIKDFRMQSKNNRLLFSMNLGLNATGEGSIRYLKSGDKRKVEIKIDKVRAGIFNVTRRFFEALGSVPDNVEVNRPYITIHLDE